MSASATIQLYELLRVKLGEPEARSFIANFEESVEEKFDQKKDVLATKLDLANLRAELIEKIAESHNGLVKWMFAFWIGQIAVLTGIILAIVKGLVR